MLIKIGYEFIFRGGDAIAHVNDGGAAPRPGKLGARHNGMLIEPYIPFQSSAWEFFRENVVPAQPSVNFRVWRKAWRHPTRIYAHIRVGP